MPRRGSRQRAVLPDRRGRTGPGEVVSFHLENSDVRPVEYRLIANSDGAWRQFYVPFLWHREGGTVRVDLQSATCALSLSFGWERRRP